MRFVYDERTRFDIVGITYIPVNSVMSSIMWDPHYLAMSCLIWPIQLVSMFLSKALAK